MSTRTPLRVLIVGAGAGGLCLAHGLKRAGIDVAVYERDRTRTDGLHGYRVGIDSDGSRALHACLPPELFATFAATCARAPRYFNILTEQLDEVLSLPLTNETDPIESEKSVSRMTLRQVLLTGLEEIVRFDKTFTRYEQHPDGTVTAFFADGTCATGDLLVGSDGTSSPVRKQYLPHARLEDTGIVAIAGKLPLTAETGRLVPRKVFYGVSMVMAPWPSSSVTLIGDAIHTMTPGHGVGANTALRDAELLCRNLIPVERGHLTLRDAVAGYESRMREYAWPAVLRSRQQMDGDAIIHKPLVGRLALAGIRAGMRIVNHLPPLKQRMADGLQRERGAHRSHERSTIAVPAA